MPAHTKQKHISRLPKRKHFLGSLLVICTIFLVFIISFYIEYSSVRIYQGTLPCADCAGIQTTLSLNGDHTYSLKSLYIDRGQPYTEQGVWQQGEKNNYNVYVLQSGKLITYYEITDDGSLKMLDTFGNPINTPFNLELKRIH